MLSEKQEKWYWRLWSGLRKNVEGVDRKEAHAALGLPESHTAWNNGHFDKWKGHCLAAAEPGNYKAQAQQIKMPEIRKRVFIDHLLCALGRDEMYAEGILKTMNRNGKQGSKWVTLDTLGEAELEDVMIALKKECRRAWPTKADLLAEIEAVAKAHDCGPKETEEALLKALCWKSLPAVARLYYEPLLVVLSVLRTMAGGSVAAADPDWTV